MTRENKQETEIKDKNQFKFFFSLSRCMQQNIQTQNNTQRKTERKTEKHTFRVRLVEEFHEECFLSSPTLSHWNRL